MIAGTYDLIYADPPWHYAARKTGTHFGGGVTDKYPTMTVPAIAALPVESIARPDSVLMIWTTMPYLMQTQQVIDGWGFRYITCGFTWIKTNPVAGTVFAGVGNYTKSNAELCLIAKRGSGLKRASRSVQQVIMAPRREHSRKPDEAYDRIEQLFGVQDRVELFARNYRAGWASWGNQLD
jgi:N6-adenosine-specific RNA methylase IME4